MDRIDIGKEIQRVINEASEFAKSNEAVLLAYLGGYFGFDTPFTKGE